MEYSIESAKLLMERNQYKECERMIVHMMMEQPHSAIPHNLMGILLEKEGNHILAMKHFRAAYALEPTYIPARMNMDMYGELGVSRRRSCCYSEADLPVK